MRIHIKKIVDSTPAFKRYIEEKLLPLARYIKHFDKTGEAEIWLEVSRTTEHHRKGDVFRAAVDLRLPGRILRADERADDARKAVNFAKDALKIEIEKYKTQMMDPRQRARKKAK